MTETGCYAELVDPMCLALHVQTALLGDVPYRRFAVAGDSLSLGTGDHVSGYRRLGWSDRIARALADAQPELQYRNSAIIGATTREVIDRQYGAIMEFGPDLLHVSSGANDITAKRADFSRIEYDLRQMYELAASTGAQLMTFTLGRAYVVPRIEDWTARITAMNEMVRGIAAEYGAIVIEMWDHPVNDRADLLSADRIHFAAPGQAVMATEVTRALAAHVSNQRPTGAWGQNR
ncbi:SGNH/GDSL hydrolase family protein [Epidermidibacterium keratini]|uniref:SGNH/GDSL hydrolase family protein n=1 Tax=Epidermidibacterium keratini TaxID=1891644 RepID=A0A7L4YN16_9ACTN|nr:SGNH/GDSL hydrolase family protein [Epidermidibacterium keratini]QHC00468.1 SGNH/GDSL hydrolase family protein [Epidermidibacterium keratini]